MLSAERPQHRPDRLFLNMELLPQLKRLLAKFIFPFI
jgi:hypothetical protein